MDGVGVGGGGGESSNSLVENLFISELYLKRCPLSALIIQIISPHELGTTIVNVNRKRISKKID